MYKCFNVSLTCNHVRKGNKNALAAKNLAQILQKIFIQSHMFENRPQLHLKIKMRNICFSHGQLTAAKTFVQCFYFTRNHDLKTRWQQPLLLLLLLLGYNWSACFYNYNLPTATMETGVLRLQVLDFGTAFQLICDKLTLALSNLNGY